MHRGGRGPYGAGNVQQEALEAEKDPAAAVPDIDDVDVVTPAGPEEEDGAEVNGETEPAGEVAGEGETAAPAEPEAPPEPPTFTLEEYQERQKEARLRALAKVEARQERVVDTAAYSDLVAKEKDSLEDDRVASRKERVKSQTAAQQILDVGFKFNSPSHDRDYRDGGRGGRGDRDREGGRGGRGGRGQSGRGGSGGRGSPRGAVLNPKDFPAL